MSWQPIETAPVDGTFVLICMPSGHVTIGQWHSVGSWGYWRNRVTQWPWQAFTPRWWQPLPTAPDESRADDNSTASQGAAISAPDGAQGAE